MMMVVVVVMMMIMMKYIVGDPEDCKFSAIQLWWKTRRLFASTFPFVVVPWKISLIFVEPYGPLSRLQEPASGLHPEADVQCTTHVLPIRSIFIFSFHLRQDVQSSPFLVGFPLNPIAHFSLPCLPCALPILSPAFPRFNNIWRGLQITNLLIMLFYPDP